jgi:hypothetical protein
MLTAFVVFIHIDWRVPDECLSADGLTDTCYCEALQPGRVRQPVNTWSSLLFIIAGLVVVAPRPARGRPEPLVLQTLFGMLAVYLGVGSMAFHATQSDIGGFIDSSGMYLLPSLFIAVQVGRLRGHDVRWTGAGWAGGNAALFSLDRWEPTLATELFTGLIVVLAVVLVPVLRRERWSWSVHGPLVGVVGSFLTGTAVWLLSGTGAPLCRPDSAFQGHAVWHLATATSVALLYEYVRRAPPLDGNSRS